MWIAKDWKDYELLDCGGGVKLERWDRQVLVRPDPQAICETDKTRGCGAAQQDAIPGLLPAAVIGIKASCRKAGRCITKT